jgi:hypothetical protein
LHDDAYLAAGFPIATGVIAGACRHLVQERMAVTGTRWSLAGAEAVRHLRSLWSSGDVAAYWPFYLQPALQRHHAARDARGNVPTPTSPVQQQERGSHLQRVQ